MESCKIALWSVDGVGRITFCKILKALEYYQISLMDWWLNPVKFTKLVKLNSNQSESLKIFQSRFTPQSYSEYLDSKNITPLHESDPKFPANLKVLDDHPPVIFVQGKLYFEPRAIAVVGTRKITSYGRLVTEKLVTELVNYDATIVSGFMYGVDAVAHQTTLNSGGSTIAVLGFGFDHMYPSQFAPWKQELLEAGHTFVTEYAPHVRPTKGTFPARNRLMAGLTQGVLVTEAASKSGSHITAEWANEYGRSVYAVPGPITNPYTEGTKALINEGAMFVQSAHEIAQDLQWTSLSPLSEKIYVQLKTGAQSLSTLSAQFQVPSSIILSGLTHLELAGLITRDATGWKVKNHT